MEFLAVVFGLALIFSFFAALIGVPILFRRIGELKERVSVLEHKAAALASKSSVSLQESSEKATDAKPEVRDVSLAQPETFVAAEEAVSSTRPESVPKEEAKELVSNALNESSEAESTISATEPSQPAEPVKPQPWDSLNTSKMKLLPKEGESTEPSMFRQLLDKLLALNITAQVGAIVLIFGAIFLGKYASDIGVLTLQMRLVLMAVVSVALFVGGIFLTRKFKIYGDILQATGLAGWMVTLFVAHVLTEQIHWVPTLIAGVVGVLFLGFRAIRQDSQVLAMVAYLGGFLAPFIASSEVSSLWRLFAYMVLLNAAATAITAVKHWKWFTREFTVATFGLLGALLLAEHLQNDLDQWVIQFPFMTFTFISTALFSLLAARWVSTSETDVLKHLAGLLFGVPAACAVALQTIFLSDATLCAVALAGVGVWYVVLFAWQRAWVFLAVGIILISGAFPYALSDSLTTLIYSLEGAAFVWWAVKYQRVSGFLWGLLLQVAACLFALNHFQDATVRDANIHLSWVVFGAVIAAGFLSAWWYQRAEHFLAAWNTSIHFGLLTWSFVVWFYQWAFWLAEMSTRHHTVWWFAFVAAGTAAVTLALSRVLQWAALQQFVRWIHLLFLATVVMYLADYSDDAAPLRLLSLVALTFVFAGVRYFQALRHGKIESWEASLLWFGTLATSSFALFHAPITQTDWNWVLVALVWLPPMFFVQTILNKTFKPRGVRSSTRWISLFVLVGWIVLSLSLLGNYAPLPFWPILHPVLLCSIAAGEILFRFIRRQSLLRMIWVVLMGMVITVEINRWLFHYAGVQFELEYWMESALTQTVWSLIWTVIGGILMLMGARWALSRTRWLVGAGILGLVVLKLFVLDLSQVDTLYRILSFIGVGGLLLAIGYFAPMPKPQENAP